ncbi:unnamed protein product [Trichogramma brassicae]|uniref:Uncharacterized protein n=1 Tax=Trichogramma brassicae TaxID=86971 RepID=A0A6H5I3P0_9HYME|nr:unnamed protein product [Trichogramma brassicae]
MESQTLDKERAQYEKRNPAQLRTYYIFLCVIPAILESMMSHCAAARVCATREKKKKKEQKQKKNATQPSAQQRRRRSNSSNSGSSEKNDEEQQQQRMPILLPLLQRSLRRRVNNAISSKMRKRRAAAAAAATTTTTWSGRLWPVLVCIVALEMTATGRAALGQTKCIAAPCTCDEFGRLLSWTSIRYNNALLEITQRPCVKYILRVYRELQLAPRRGRDGGQFLRIEVELYLTSEGEHPLARHTSRINVTNCPNVMLANNSLAHMDGLVSIDLINVANLTLLSHSFKLSPKATHVLVTVRNSSLAELPSNVFHGNIETIDLENVNVDDVMSFSFANLYETQRISLTNCHLARIEQQAFKKFDVKYLHVVGGTFGSEQVLSRTMHDVEVYEKFMLSGVRMGQVHSSAFIVRKPLTFMLVNSHVDSLESEAFDVTIRRTVHIKNNTLGSVAFGAFLSIRADPENKPSGGAGSNLHKLTFSNNSLGDFEEGSLIFDRTSFHTELSNVLVNQSCDCERLATWKSQILNYTNAHARRITFLDSTNIVAPPFALESGGSEDPETFLCVEDLESGQRASFVDYEQRKCALSGSMLLLISAVSGLLLLLLMAGCVAVYCCKRRAGREEGREKQRWISVPTTAPDVVGKDGSQGGAGGASNGHHRHPKEAQSSQQSGGGGGPVDSRITMVVPDGRLYRETEFHVIVEKAEPLTTEFTLGHAGSRHRTATAAAAATHQHHTGTRQRNSVDRQLRQQRQRQHQQGGSTLLFQQQQQMQIQQLQHQMSVEDANVDAAKIYRL